MKLEEVLRQKNKGETSRDVIRRLHRGNRVSYLKFLNLLSAVRAAEYYEENPLLQQIPNEILDDSSKLVEYLRANRDKMNPSKAKKCISLGFLVHALVMGRKIAEKQKKELVFDASAAEHYEKNHLLQQIPNEILSDSFRLVEYLRANRGKMISPKKKKYNSLGYLVHALAMGKKIPKEKRVGIALDVTAAEYYERNLLLQQIPDNVLSDSFKLVEYLRTNRDKMAFPEDKKHNSLGYLVHALVMGKKILKEKHMKIAFDVGAAEYYEKNPLLQQIPDKILDDSFKLIEYLKNNRDKMTSPEKKKYNSLGYLVLALVMGKKILKEKHMKIAFDVGAAEHYEKNPLLQQIPDKILDDSFKLIEYLRANRAKMTFSEKRGYNSLGYLAHALIMGGRIAEKQKKELLFNVGAAEHYEKNHLLQQIPNEILSDSFRLVEYLRANRGEMISPKKKKYNSLGYLVHALVMGGRIPKEKRMKIVFSVSAADYALRNKDMISAEILKSYQELSEKQKNSYWFMSHLKRGIDRSKFTHLKNPNKIISDVYFNMMMRYAMFLYGNKLITT